MRWWKRARDNIRIARALRAARRTGKIDKARAALDRIKYPILSDAYLELHRVVHGRPVAEPRLWRLVLHWKAVDDRAPAGVGGFFRHYMVAEQSLHLAVAAAKNLEPERDWAVMEIDQWEDCGACEHSVAGVIEASGPAWYGPDGST